MPLLLVLHEGLELEEALTARLKGVIRTALSAYHVPDEIMQAVAISHTMSARKKMERPLKKLLLGADPAKVMTATRWPTPTASTCSWVTQSG
jgi:acetoacetyl-CoA synthetase